jgi:hypothetical protein
MCPSVVDDASLAQFSEDPLGYSGRQLFTRICETLQQIGVALSVLIFCLPSHRKDGLPNCI